MKLINKTGFGMEDGSNGSLSDVEVSESTKNGVVAPIMANFPEGTVAVIKDSKPNNTDHITEVNGDHQDESNPFEDEYSSESDVLVIDESVPKQKSRKKVNKKKSTSETGAVIAHSNPYFNESIFDLSQQHQQSQGPPADAGVKSESNCKHKQKRGKTKPKPPKLREYAQYLGLQPTVQFKCSKCGRAGFESLNTLQEHVVQCDAVQNVPQLQPTEDNSYSGFKLTRKVFLCSACGTYYENWNLYMHMLEFHRRYICLYCLGMFSVLEDLCQHIQSRHNLEPGYKNTLDEFFNVYNEPCYITCCECNKLFSEQDNFFYHNCVNSVNKNSQKNKIKPTKTQIRPENHVTGESVEDNSIPAEISAVPIDKNIEPVEKSIETTTISDLSAESSRNDQSCTDPISTADINSPKLISRTTGGDVSSPPPVKTPPVDDSLDETVPSEGEKDVEPDDLPHSSDDNHDDQREKTSEKDDTYDIMNGEHLPHIDEDSMDENPDDVEPVAPIETRKVPKLSLKLPKPGSYRDLDVEDAAEDSEDSEKLTMEVEQVESECETNHIESFEESEAVGPPQMAVAGQDISIIELELEQPLDKFDIRVLLQKCLKATAPTCIYCNHARKIAVNGKQLGLHAIAEHRFAGTVNSITAEELIPESFVTRIKESLADLETVFFNLESASDEAVTFSHNFECFPCRYSTAVHKELYLHNRKLHAKNLLLCIMCKSNFYSYSELVCHLCPGLYVLDYDIQFRCCMCISDDLPSAFRLMVHLRKRHHVCDVCLEICHNQYRLSNHVWKHKLHHFCYRCGIAYRNKPDITRHLFWKHGTESVLCKKCLQKKWPHVYHFCVPPTSFSCEECNLTFTKAVSLKVHKRIHTNEKKHQCIFEGCEERFISKKLMLKHELKHREPVPDPKKDDLEKNLDEEVKEPEEMTTVDADVKVEEKIEEKPKPKVDVYDLPELNLSESDSSDSETEPVKEEPTKSSSSNEVLEESIVTTGENVEVNQQQEELEKSAMTMENIWDNFRNYQANKVKMDHIFGDVEKGGQSPQIVEPIVEELTPEVALRDHDYYIDPERKQDTSLTEVKPDLTMTERVDHDYCSPKVEITTKEKPMEQQEKTKIENTEKKPRRNSTSSDSSSDSDSSSCSCGSNCSCSSSSGSSSSTSDSSESDSSTEEGRRRQQARKLRRKERGKKKTNKESEKVVDVVATNDQPTIFAEIPIEESDLETTESETDEEFYDKQPQKLAKKILEEKRNQLLAEMGPIIPNGTTFIESTSRPPTPPSYVEEPKPKKKSKSKKRKKKKSERKDLENIEYEQANIPMHPPYYHHHHHSQQYQSQTVAPITLSLRNSPVSITSDGNSTTPLGVYPKIHSESNLSRQDSNDSSLRASKRRRVPNKFYGYSSDEEHDKKWRKVEAPFRPHSPKVVPPITIKTGPPPPPPPAPVQPTVEPLSIRVTANPAEMRINRRTIPPMRLLPPRPPPPPPPADRDSGTDSNDSSAEEQVLPKPNQPQLYCYCRCPYDEVSEMIGCDSNDCAIEWFHFECVGIMVPPKGQWFCPDCRKKKQQRRELLQT